MVARRVRMSIAVPSEAFQQPRDKNWALASAEDPMSLILYTEDDAILLADGDAVLRDAGYEVLLASTGAEACALLGSQGARVSALVTDINLAGEMQGWSVAEAGREINPDLPVVYVSASDRREFARRGVADSV